MEQKNIYLVFSHTPYKIGSFIRVMTHSEYNHVSIALDPNLNEMYSFSRFYKNAPFYAGFTRESALRYFNNGTYAKVKVCKIPVSDTQYARAIAFLNEFKDNKDKYYYNFYSAFFTLFHKRVNVHNCFTCVEFCCEFLRSIGINTGIEQDKFCSVKKLENAFENYSLYTGQINKISQNASWAGDKFVQKTKFLERTRLYFIAQKNLFKSLFAKTNAQ